MLNLAELCARKSPSRIRVGAVIADGKRPIALGWNNMLKSHPLFHPANMHAELDAVLSAPYIEGCDIYVVRLRRDNARALAMPCDRCWQILRDKGVRHIYYSIDNGALYEEARP